MSIQCIHSMHSLNAFTQFFIRKPISKSNINYTIWEYGTFIIIILYWVPSWDFWEYSHAAGQVHRTSSISMPRPPLSAPSTGLISDRVKDGSFPGRYANNHYSANNLFRSDEECLIEQNGTGLGAVSAALVGFPRIIQPLILQNNWLFLERLFSDRFYDCWSQYCWKRIIMFQKLHLT